MRTKLAIAGLVAGVSLSILPMSPASAVCYWDLEGMQQCGCPESELAGQVDGATEDAREEHGIGGLGDHVVCLH